MKCAFASLVPPSSGWSCCRGVGTDPGLVPGLTCATGGGGMAKTGGYLVHCVSLNASLAWGLLVLCLADFKKLIMQVGYRLEISLMSLNKKSNQFYFKYLLRNSL
ncbi:hypothetical protein GOODEAATRI_017178 [Goodea atripinnis]|uniref:Uncharacterized protein n=1 Tax=Goodea atripinnis TaxID=208336 RepID=A0ABV0NB99_9TELE